MNQNWGYRFPKKSLLSAYNTFTTLCHLAQLDWKACGHHNDQLDLYYSIMKSKVNAVMISLLYTVSYTTA